jgi:hypothetical protein
VGGGQQVMLPQCCPTVMGNSGAIGIPPTCYLLSSEACTSFDQLLLQGVVESLCPSAALSLLLPSLSRYFSTWKHKGVVEMMPLPPQAGLGPQLVAFGDGVLRLQDTVLAGE